MKPYSRLLSLRRLSFVLVLAPIILFCLVPLTSILKLQFIKNREDQQDRSTRAYKTRAERFVWSNEIQDWTLKRQESFDSGEEAEEKLCIWPEEDYGIGRKSDDDRIVDQLMLSKQQDGELFRILPTDPALPIGQQVFLDDGCLVNKCLITYDNEEADALIFQNSDVFEEPPKWRRKNQVWIAYLLESPPNTFDRRFSRIYRGKHEFNWTASYRSDSDIVAPYSKFVPYLDRLSEYKSLRRFSSNIQNRTEQLLANINELKRVYEQSSDRHKSLIASKRLKVAWFVSNCNTSNGRLELANKLAKYIQVDIYGKCGNLTCHKWNHTSCFELVNKEYKFYLSFENSNCPDYITEKLYGNALGYSDLNHLVLPIVLGAPRADYERLVPPASYIHVDEFSSLEGLVNYLKLLDSNDALYYSYFRWKTVGNFIDSKFLCRVCAMLHESHITGKRRSYPNIQDWWNSSSCQLG